MQLLEMEDVDDGEDQAARERDTLFSVSALARGSSASGPQVHRPSEDLGANLKGRNAVHAGEKGKGGILPVEISRTRLWQHKMTKKIGKFVDGRVMVGTSVAVTIYALVGDDLRLLCTNRPADPFFNAIALLCLLFFTVEIILSSIGKPDYFLGFFFCLDMVATCSLLLDLTWVSEPLMSEQNLNAGDNARSGRTARLGATVGRVVRVLRLMRIVKLYRAYFEKMTRKARSHENGLLSPSEEAYDDWDNDEEWAEAEVAHEESRRESAVGKKLVSLTTRRVILMVLVMLMVLPYLRVDMSDVNPTSAAWGVDSIWESFVRLEQNASVSGEYEDKFLRYLYFHNWFEAGKACVGKQLCPNDFWMHPFWVGFAGSNVAQLQQKVQVAQVTQQALNRWDSLSSNPRILFHSGTMPAQASSRLTAPWVQMCSFGGVPHLGVSLLSTKIDGHVDHAVGCPTDLRPTESLRVHPHLLTQAQFDAWHLVFFFDTRPFTREESFLALIATGFICFILCVSTLFFSKDANKLVLKPVERMVEKVKTIANDPLIALKMADAEFELEEFLKYKSTKQRTGRFAPLFEKWNRLMQVMYPPSNEHQNLETAVLEKTIIKLGSLLALGFGEAGANIVSSNMRGLDSSGVNAMIPGSRVDCIIGQTRISNFGFATEVLQGKVMNFVNQIAEVVHGIVNEYHGASNKNMGDTFVLIWRIAGMDDTLRTRHADLSIISFARILACVHESPILARYRGHPGLQQRLGSRFRLNLSFGLHSGWAIEGAVGSEFKIDASYLSPNVSIAESLEQATRIYGVSILASESVIMMSSPTLAQKCRLIDRVIIKGSKEPLNLYTLDLDTNALQVVETRSGIIWNMRQRFRARQMLEVEKRERIALDVDVVVSLFDFSPQMSQMRESYTEEFLQVFKMGFRNYEEGEWQAARRFLSRTLDLVGVKDGPSNYLLRYMGAAYDFESPANWRGVHPLEVEGTQMLGGT